MVFIIKCLSLFNEHSFTLPQDIRGYNGQCMYHIPRSHIHYNFYDPITMGGWIYLHHSRSVKQRMCLVYKGEIQSDKGGNEFTVMDVVVKLQFLVTRGSFTLYITQLLEHLSFEAIYSTFSELKLNETFSISCISGITKSNVT